MQFRNPNFTANTGFQSKLRLDPLFILAPKKLLLSFLLLVHVISSLGLANRFRMNLQATLRFVCIVLYSNLDKIQTEVMPHALDTPSFFLGVQFYFSCHVKKQNLNRKPAFLPHCLCLQSLWFVRVSGSVLPPVSQFTRRAPWGWREGVCPPLPCRASRALHS